MRKLLLILFLFPVVTSGQVTISVYNNTYSTLGVSAISGSYTAGKLYIFFVGISNTGSTPATVSLSGTGQTWTEFIAAGGILNGSSFRRLQVFRFAPTSNNTNQTNLSYTGSQDGSFLYALEITGAATTGTNGSDAIVQATLSSANGADPTLTLGSAITNGNSVISAFINSVNPFTGTEESGWTEGSDGGYATPDTGGYLMYRIFTSDNTPTVTMSSGNWAGMAFELRASGRRVIITN